MNPAQSRSEFELLQGGRRIDESYVVSASLQQIASSECESVEHFLSQLRPFLANATVTEVVINRPGVACIETADGWREFEVPNLTMERLMYLGTAVATQTKQDLSEEKPILGATLPTGERIQIVIPPAVERDSISITLRKPSTTIWRLADFERQGLFSAVRIITDSREAVAKSEERLEEAEQELLELLWDGRVAQFIRAAVRRRRNIVVSGATGSGKTTFMKGIIQECSRSERLITIEDAREIFLPDHPNRVHLLYSKNGQGVAKVTAQMLLVSCLRMKPDRILLAEVREGECYDFLRTAASGHPGSITSLHAGSCSEAFEQMGLMIRQSSAGAGLAHAETQRLLRLLVDVVVQYQKDADGRRVSEIYYRPLRKKELTA
jgi:type IV secretion system protein VirB11